MRLKHEFVAADAVDSFGFDDYLQNEAQLFAALEYWDVIGKTGTGQNPLSVRGLAEDHAWFAGRAGPPGDRPEIVVVALVEYGRSGGQVAAPIVAKTADFYLRQKYGIPVDTIQTFREHIMIGPVPRWYRERFPDSDFGRTGTATDAEPNVGQRSGGGGR